MGYRGKNKKYFTPSGLEVRSGLELAVATYLEEEGIKYEYESITLTWNERYPRAKCNECGSSEIYQQRKYVPDFILGNGVVIETKGRLTSRDRKILAGVRKCNPDANIKLLF